MSIFRFTMESLPMFRSRTAFVAAALALATLPAMAGAPLDDDATKTADVPFEMLISNHMMVKAKINGQGPYRLIFDLGAPITLLSNRAAEEGKVLGKNAPKSFLFAMRGEAVVNQLEVGGLSATDLPVVVMDHPALSALGTALGEPLDGIIGFTFFARYKTTIDYQKKVMTFVPVDYKVKNVVDDFAKRMAGPRVGRRKVLAPGALLGFVVGKPSGEGIEIAEVYPGTPAEASGLRPGDILIRLDGRWTTSEADTHHAAVGLEPGKKTDLAVTRNGQDVELSIVPIEGF